MKYMQFKSGAIVDQKQPELDPSPTTLFLSFFHTPVCPPSNIVFFPFSLPTTIFYPLSSQHFYLFHFHD